MRHDGYKKQSPETIQSREQTMSQFGFRDRPGFYNLGLSRVPIKKHSALNANGERIHLIKLDYPITGSGIEYLLSGTAPQKQTQTREGIIADWILPDEARAKIAQGLIEDQDVKRHQRHEHMPAYKEFDAQHRVRWIKELRNTEYDRDYQLLGQVEFVNPTVFTRNLLRKWKHLERKESIKIGGEVLGYLANWDRGQEYESLIRQCIETSKPVDRKIVEKFSSLSYAFETTRRILKEKNTPPTEVAPGYYMVERTQLLLPQDSTATIRHFSNFLDIVESRSIPRELRENLVMSLAAYLLPQYGYSQQFMDPVSGRTWTRAVEWEQPVGNVTISAERQKKGNMFSTKAMAVTVDLSSVDETGRYDKITSKQTFKDRPNDPYLYPVIAIAEGRKGRRFLTQKEADPYIPAQWRENANPDVMWGRIGLAYLLPEKTKLLPTEMLLEVQRNDPSYDARFAGRTQRMNNAQLPVWVSFPGFAKKLFDAKQVTRLIHPTMFSEATHWTRDTIDTLRRKVA